MRQSIKMLWEIVAIYVAAAGLCALVIAILDVRLLGGDL